VPHLAAGARVAWIGSGTHDPDDRGATRFGFRGGQYRTSERVARGDYGAGTAPAQAARDAYATSKLCNIVAASAWAERLGDRARVFAFDPGLMPGTGLARAHGALQRFAWSRVLPLAARFLDGTSTPARSAAILAAFVTGARRLPQNGRYVDCAGEELMPAKAARDPAIAADLMAFCDRQFAAEACMPSIAA
jgi:protochlorophyllide reductase